MLNRHCPTVTHILACTARVCEHDRLRVGAVPGTRALQVHMIERAAAATTSSLLCLTLLASHGGTPTRPAPGGWAAASACYCCFQSSVFRPGPSYLVY